jgi:hypothetical protein
MTTFRQAADQLAKVLRQIVRVLGLTENAPINDALAAYDAACTQGDTRVEELSKENEFLQCRLETAERTVAAYKQAVEWVHEKYDPSAFDKDGDCVAVATLIDLRVAELLKEKEHG